MGKVITYILGGLSFRLQEVYCNIAQVIIHKKNIILIVVDGMDGIFAPQIDMSDFTNCGGMCSNGGEWCMCQLCLGTRDTIGFG